MLDQLKVESLMPHEYECVHHGVTQLGIQSKFKQKSLYNSVIKRINWGTSCPRTWNKPHVKMTRQTNIRKNLNTLFIYYWYSFLLWGASPKVHIEFMCCDENASHEHVLVYPQ